MKIDRMKNISIKNMKANDLMVITERKCLLKPFSGYCEYKGRQYHQNDRWDDGCDYTCDCENEENVSFFSLVAFFISLP